MARVHLKPVSLYVGMDVRRRISRDARARENDDALGLANGIQGVLGVVPKVRSLAELADIDRFEQLSIREFIGRRIRRRCFHLHARRRMMKSFSCVVIMSVNNDIVPLLSAEEKLRQLAARDDREIKSARTLVIKRVQKLMAKAIEEAPAIPFDLLTDAFSHDLFGGYFDWDSLSQWLRDAEYCLRVEYRDTGNNDIITRLTIGLYKSRGYDAEGAIAQHEMNGLFPPEYF
jgi:hypothetical protein